jgi:hypothetical protein
MNNAYLFYYPSCNSYYCILWVIYQLAVVIALDAFVLNCIVLIRTNNSEKVIKIHLFYCVQS